MSIDQLSAEMEEFFDMRVPVKDQWTPEEFAQHRADATDGTMQKIYHLYP